MSLVNAVIGSLAAGAAVSLGLSWVMDRLEQIFGGG